MGEDAAELAPLLDQSDPMFELLPVPGGGDTPARFRGLWNLATRSPALGRVAEAHHDAIAILQESGRPQTAPLLHAVWGAGGPDPLRLSRHGGRWHLRGSKHWCSASTLARRALVTADAGEGGGVLVLVDLDDEGVRPADSTWESPAMRVVDTRTMTFDLDVDESDIVGCDDWYLRRPGFWHGAIGVAAIWAGCVDGIVSRLLSSWRDDPHAAAHLGAVDALLWSMRSALDAAGRDIDAEPVGSEHDRQLRAFRARQVVDAAVGEILGRIPRALGPGPLAYTPRLHRHLAETDLYRRQSHAERDMETLGRLVLTPAGADR